MSWGVCYSGSNNIHFNFPPIMADGRNYASWQPDAVVNQRIQKEENIHSNWSYRQYLQNNGTKIMNYNNMEACYDLGLDPYFKTDKKNRMTVNNDGVSIDGKLNLGKMVINENEINWNVGGSKIYENSNLNIESDDDIIFSGKKVRMPAGASLCNSNGSICVDVADIVRKGKDYNINNRNWGTLKSYQDKGVGVRDGSEGNWTNWRIE